MDLLVIATTVWKLQGIETHTGLSGGAQLLVAR
jgi:hypothetical protein